MTCRFCLIALIVSSVLPCGMEPFGTHTSTSETFQRARDLCHQGHNELLMAYKQVLVVIQMVFLI